MTKIFLGFLLKKSKIQNQPNKIWHNISVLVLIVFRTLFRCINTPQLSLFFIIKIYFLYMLNLYFFLRNMSFHGSIVRMCSLWLGYLIRHRKLHEIRLGLVKNKHRNWDKKWCYVSKSIMSIVWFPWGAFLCIPFTAAIKCSLFFYHVQ